MREVIFLISLIFSLNSFSQEKTKVTPAAPFLISAFEKAKLNDFRSALLSLDSAEIADPNFEEVYAFKAEILCLMKRFYEAAENYQKALILNTDSSYLVGAYVHLGVLYEKAGCKTEANAQYEYAIFLFENKKYSLEKQFKEINEMDYARALKLAQRESALKIQLDKPGMQYLKDTFGIQSREQVLERYIENFITY